MALDDLQGVIEKLRKMIATHRDYLSGDETRTRQVLIDPLLRELGWDVSDPEAVELEYRVGQQRADYALIFNGRRVALIEAKRLGSDLEYNEIMQVLNYANRDGIDYIIVTNGDKWEMYEVFRPAALEERLLMKLGLSQQPAHKNALQALAMWKPNLASDGALSEATEPVFISPNPAPDQPSSQLNEQPEQQLPNASLEDSDNWCSFEDKIYPPDTKPAKLKIGNSPPVTVKNWKEAIHKVAAWLADEEILSTNDCPIGGEVYTFIGSEAVNPNGTPFRKPQSLSNGLILQPGYLNTQEQWRKLRQLLRQPEKQRQINPSQIRVSYEPTGQANR